MPFRTAALVLAALLGFSGCAPKPSVRPPIADLHQLEQHVSAYAEAAVQRPELLELQRHYRQHYFAPWKVIQPPMPLEEALWPFESYRPEDAYGLNLQPLPAAWFDAMKAKSNFEAYGSVNRYAMTLRAASLRNFPTDEPLFRNPERAGEGFPFDYLQNSAVHPNEPLFVSHYSLDGAWAYAFTAYATGWLRTDAFTLLSTEQSRGYAQGEFVLLLEDHLPLHDETDGTFLFEGRIGMMLPLIGGSETHYRVMTLGTDGRRQSAWVPKASASESFLPLTPEHHARIGDAMMSTRYGWGGLFGERDCSSFVRDYFMPFGLWLPRNSYQQSQVGKRYTLEALSVEAKREAIIEHGIAFETLLYKPGHIMLYLGVHGGKILVLHDTWGIKTLHNGLEGRIVIGKTVVSTLELGKEQEGYQSRTGLLEGIESMNVLTEAETF